VDARWIYEYARVNNAVEKEKNDAGKP